MILKVQIKKAHDFKSKDKKGQHRIASAGNCGR
jgi:hypothetical protein